MIYLSVIVPVYNEEMFVADTLSALVSQDYPRDRYEILVVDGMSTDTTRSVVESFIKKHAGLNIRLLDNPGRLSSRGRNIGAKSSKGRLIGVIDGHVYIPDNRLFASMERLKEQNAALCLARPAPLDVPGLEKGKAYWIAAARKSRIGHSRNSYIYSDHEGFVDPVSSGFAYDRAVFEMVGFFDESFDAAEDVEFHHRLKKAGIMAYTSPDLKIYSYPRESLGTLFRQQVRYGVGRARFVKKHPDGFTKETPIPAGILVYHAVSPGAILLLSGWPVIGAAYFTGLVVYWSILCVAGFDVALKEGRLTPGIWVALAIWTTHMGLGWGFLKTILSPAR